MAGRIWTWSNALSAARVLLVLPIGILLFRDDPSSRTWAVVLIAAAIASDFLDGFFARRLHQVSEWGKVIDPLADKIAVGTIAVILVANGSLPLWYVAIVLVRDLLILAGGIMIRSRKSVVPQSNWPGKIAVSAVALVLLLAVIDRPELDLLQETAIWGSIVLMALSIVVYAKRLFIGIPSPKP